jgi:hypothetical protein
MMIPVNHLDRPLLRRYARAAAMREVLQHKITGNLDEINEDLLDFETEARWLVMGRSAEETDSFGQRFTVIVIDEFWFESRSDYAMMRMWGLGE